LIAIATQCFSPDLGGIEILMTSLADALTAQGEAVSVFADRAHGGGVLQRPYPIRRFGLARPLRRLMKRRAIARAFGDETVEGLFVDSWKSVAAIPPTPAPIAAFAWGTELSPNASAAKAARIRAAFARAYSIVACSHYTADLARRHMADSSAKLIVVSPPVAPLPEPGPEARAEFDRLIAGRGPILSTLARLEPRKGVDATLRAMPALRKDHPDLVFLIAGEGDDLWRLRRLAVDLGVGDAAVFLGGVREPGRKAALLDRTDVYAMPSRRVGDSVEGYGIAYIEAAWRGVPAVAGNDGGSADAVIDGETGLLCNGADDASVLATLDRLLADEQLRKRLGATARARARAELTWSTALPKYLAAIGRGDKLAPPASTPRGKP